MSDEPVNDTSESIVRGAPPRAPRVIEVTPDEWKKRIVSEEIAELWAAGWTIQQPITFVHPVTNEGKICYLCLPPRPEKPVSYASVIDAQQQAAREINDAQAKTTQRVGVIAAVLVLNVLAQLVHWLFS